MNSCASFYAVSVNGYGKEGQIILDKTNIFVGIMCIIFQTYLPSLFQSEENLRGPSLILSDFVLFLKIESY